MSKSKVTQDPERWLRCQEPHESQEASDAALDAFLDDVSAAREKHRIAEVVILTGTIFPGEDGNPQLFAGMSRFGSDEKMAEMIAYAYGQIVAPKLKKLQELSEGR